MEKSHLIEILKCLTQKEIEEFEIFIGQLLYKASLDIIEAESLFKCIKDYFPDFNSEDLTKEHIYQKIFPNKTFIEGKIDKMMVSLNKQLRNFLLINKYLHPDNEINQLFDLSEILKTRGLDARYNQLTNQIESKFISNAELSFNQSYQTFKFEFEKHYFLSLFNKQNNDLNLPNTIKYFFIYYNIQMTELINKFKIQQWVKKIETPDYLDQIASTVEYIPDDILKSNDLIYVQKRIYNLLTNKDIVADDVHSLSVFLNANANKFDKEVLKLLHTYLRNICAILIERGATYLDLVLFNLQKESLERGYILHGGKITPSAYVSIFSIAMKLKEYTWAIKFIEEYKNIIIGGANENNYYELNLASYCFELKEYEKCISKASINFSEIHYMVLLRRLELKSYFELKSDLTSYKLDAYKMYINRISHKTYPPDKKDHQLNFINLFSQIVQSIPGDKARAQKIIKRILAKKVVADRDWLLEKARELGNLSDDEYAEAIKNPPTKE